MLRTANVRSALAACALAGALAGASALAAQAKPAAAKGAAPAAASRGPTLDRIKASGKIRLGYRSDARPFSFKDDKGNAAGYSVALCLKAVEAIRADLGLGTLLIEWVPVPLSERFAALQQGGVDIFCGADTRTLSRMQDVTFSIPIFPGGIGAMLRKDAPLHLSQVLSGRPSTEPVWRANAGQLLNAQTFTVVEGTTAQPWLAGKLSTFKLTANVVPSKDYAAGVQKLVDRQANVLFGDRAILLDYAARQATPGELVVLDRDFTYEALSLTMPRGDGDLRVIVDGTLSRFYATPAFWTLYQQWFGAPEMGTHTFFMWLTMPE